jgi:flagellar hook-associated protein 1
MLNTLNVSHTGLNAAKIAVENVSNNIANENTPGYKKRVVQVSELPQMDGRFTGRGVSADGSYRVTSQYMYDKIMSENTKSNYYDKMSNMLGGVEAIFKETDDSGFSADLNRYFQSVENLRTNPNSEIYKTTLKNSGNNLVEALKNLYSGIEKQQATEKDELTVNVNKINTILSEIGSVNEKMEKYGTSNDLLDKRDQLELELSSYVDISIGRNNGYYELKIAGEIAISNNTNVRTINVIEEENSQIDKFTTIDYNTVPNTVYDALKYNDDFTQKIFNAGDVVTYRLNNEHDISVTIGESITMDWNGDGTQTTETVDKDNLVRALVNKINTNSDLVGVVKAYNGDYSTDANGNKIVNNLKDNFLRVESTFGGTENQFDGRISIEKSSTGPRESIYKNEVESKEAESKVAIGIYDKEITIKSGEVKAQIDNLSSNSPNNKFQVYLDKLDSFVQTLSDISDKYIKTSSTEYIYGEAAGDESAGTVNTIGLFSGSSVKTLTFNENSVNDLSQEDLDYLATFQWKNNLSFDGLGQNASSDKKISLSEFFRDLKVGISADKENNDFLKETQNNIKQTLQTSYDQLTKVDKDEEMLNLVKFQAAYTANAKIVSVIDEMLQTLLGLKR